MKVARNDEADVLIAWSTARTEAKAAFGNDSVYIEKYLGKPRHIEVQVMGDGKGNAVHLGTRDCSLQRRHQKVWEEASAPTVPPEQRAEIGEICAAAMRKLKYSGAGTIEFLYENGEFYFIEMNTRLQVEHPVTERITGVDLVYEQIRVASGETLSLKQQDVHVHRPRHRSAHQRRRPADLRALAGQDQLLPPGRRRRRPRRFARSIGGYTIPPYYDSLIGKLIVYGRTREECLQRLRRAVDEFVVDGIKTTLPLFQRLIKEPDIIAGNYDIHWLEKYLAANKA